MGTEVREVRIPLPPNIAEGDGLIEFMEVVRDLVEHCDGNVCLVFPLQCVVGKDAIGLLARLAIVYHQQGGRVTLVDPGPRLVARLRTMQVLQYFHTEGCVS
jgi:hypothetical protein